MKFMLSTLLVLLLIGVVVPLDAINAQGGGLILLDRTGSMMVTRPLTGNTRCSDARNTAIAEVHIYFAMVPNGQLAVWTFAGDGYIDITGGFTDKEAAIAALEGLDPEGCGGGTPLADAMCSAADVLKANFETLDASQRILFVSTDGVETNSTGPCNGFYAQDTIPGGSWPTGSWQRNVWDKYVGEVTFFGVYWGWMTRSGQSIDPETELPVSSYSDSLFIATLAEATGGSFVYHDDEEEPEGHQVPSITNLGLLILTGLLLISGLYVAYRRRRVMDVQ